MTQEVYVPIHDPMRFEVTCCARDCYLHRSPAFYDEPATAEFLAWAHERRWADADFPETHHVCVVKDLKSVPPSENPTKAGNRMDGGEA